jgi:hypothetical protein
LVSVLLMVNAIVEERDGEEHLPWLIFAASHARILFLWCVLCGVHVRMQLAADFFGGQFGGQLRVSVPSGTKCT